MFLFYFCYVPVQEQEGREHLIPSISTNCGNCAALPALDCVLHWISGKAVSLLWAGCARRRVALRACSPS